MERFTHKRIDPIDGKETWVIDGTCGNIRIDSRGRCFGPGIDKLAKFEDLEENGQLLVLPYKIGDTVYKIVPSMNSNRMHVEPVYIDSIAVSVNVAFGSTNEYFSTCVEANHYLNEYYGGRS